MGSSYSRTNNNMTKHEDNFEYTFKTAQKASLSAREREDMKRNIRLFIAEHPVQPSLSERLFGEVSFSVLHFRPAFAAFLIVLLVGSGTSYAAEGALPGQLLYTVKTAVNENVKGALAFTSEAKAEWNATLAVRRLEEAETLASEGKLSAEARADIESRFDKHANAFDANTASLAAEENKIEVATEAQSNLEVSLKAHAAILADLSAASVAREARDEISPIVKIVERRARAVESARLATERIISRKVGSAIETAATAKKRTRQHHHNSR